MTSEMLWEWAQQNVAAAIFVAALLAIVSGMVIGPLYWLWRRQRARYAKSASAEPAPAVAKESERAGEGCVRAERALPPREEVIARIEESVAMTPGGIVALSLWFVFGALAAMALVESPTIFQGIFAMLGWIGTCLLCGVGVIVGRRRTYLVYRTLPPDADLDG